MSYEDEVLSKDCFFCGFPVQINRMVEIGGYLLCLSCARRFLEIARQWIRKDVFNCF